MDDPQHVVFLHGMGTGPESWDAQLADLPEGFVGIAPRIVGLADGDDPFTLAGAAAAVVDELDARGIDRTHVCGLSLGAMLALQVVIEYPHRVASLVLSGGQVHPSRVLMALQNAVMRILPAKLIGIDGTDKQRMLGAFRSVARIDFRPQLASIDVPTLAICGSRDTPNLPAARALADGIPGAQLQIIAGGGHELNTQMPSELNAVLYPFLTQQR